MLALSLDGQVTTVSDPPARLGNRAGEHFGSIAVAVCGPPPSPSPLMRGRGRGHFLHYLDTAWFVTGGKTNRAEGQLQAVCQVLASSTDLRDISIADA